MIRIVYFGTAPFAVPALKALGSATGLCEVVGVVSQPDKPAGRQNRLTSSPVAAQARELGLHLLQPKTLKDDAAREAIAALRPDAIIVAAYGKIIPKAILELPRLGCLNLHGSLLPKYRGASPIQAAILEGEKKTGVSLMLMDELVDHGPVIAAARLAIAPDDTHASLEIKLGDLAADLLRQNLEAYAEGRLQGRTQAHEAASFTKILGREDGLVDWSIEDAARIGRKLRAYTPWPGIAALWPRGDKILRLKILETRAMEAATQPGKVFLSPDGFPAVGAADGAVVLVSLQLEGKTPVSGKQFLAGYRDFVGSVLASKS